MKNKNQRELEKHWAEQQKKASKPVTTAPKKKSPEAADHTPAPTAEDSPGK
jgi:hypothetical protein